MVVCRHFPQVYIMCADYVAGNAFNYEDNLLMMMQFVDTVCLVASSSSMQLMMLCYFNIVADADTGEVFK